MPAWLPYFLTLLGFPQQAHEPLRLQEGLAVYQPSVLQDVLVSTDQQASTSHGAASPPATTILDFMDLSWYRAYRLAVAATAVPTFPPTDPVEYNASAVVKCWHESECQYTYDTIERCFNNYGPLVDPNDSTQSRGFQSCICGTVNAASSSQFTLCTECLRRAGIPSSSVDFAGDSLSSFCLSPDPNLFLWLSSFVNFTLGCAPEPADNYTSSWTLPLSGSITAISTLQSLYSSDPAANSVFTSTKEQTLWAVPSNGPPVPVSTIAVPTGGSAKPSGSDTSAGEDSESASGSAGSTAQVVTYVTAVQVMSTSTLATRGGSAIVLIAAVPGASTTTTVTATFGAPTEAAETGTRTLMVSAVEQRSGGVRVASGNVDKAWWRVGSSMLSWVVWLTWKPCVILMSCMLVGAWLLL